MSKTFRSFLPIFAASVLILHLFNNSNAQDIEATIKLDSSQPEIVSISGKNLKIAGIPRRNLAFLTSVAGIDVSDERISDVKLFDANGTPVSYKRFAPGEYVADAAFERWSYQVKLTSPKDQKLLAHMSWMMKNTGIIALDDLLPEFPKSENIRAATVIFDIPEEFRRPAWPIRTSVPRLDKNYYGFNVTDITQTTFHIGRGWNCLEAFNLSNRKSSATVSTCYLGDIHPDFERGLMVTAIHRDYQARFGGQALSVEIAIIKLGHNTKDTWEAETRGRNITIVTSDTAFASQAEQQLHEQLRHEMFHLWFPNGVNLSGNYDWFYEGFALYQSLKTGVALNRIRFDDYLDTLSRAYDINKGQNQKLSLLDASRNRWVGDNNTLIYARGMLVAFLCDLALLEKSKGKRSVTDLLRKLYESHKPPNPETDGNAAVLKLLGSYSELTSIIDRNITGSESIEWSDLLKGAGLEAALKDQTAKLKVIAKPSGRQKDLLDKLGYNNWRKLASKQ